MKNLIIIKTCFGPSRTYQQLSQNTFYYVYIIILYITTFTNISEQKLKTRRQKQSTKSKCNIFDIFLLYKFTYILYIYIFIHWRTKKKGIKHWKSEISGNIKSLDIIFILAAEFKIKLGVKFWVKFIYI